MTTTNKLLLAAAFVSLASSASAGEINPCNVWSFSITGAIQSQYYNDGDTVPSLPSNISATSCAGVYEGNNDQQDLQNPSPNLGYLGDGLLNGQHLKENGQISATPFFDPTTFVDPSKFQDLKGDGGDLDPGWIMLGALGGNAGTLNYSTITTSEGTFNLGNFVTYTQTKTDNVSGGWLLTVDADIVEALAEIGLDRSVFDHLAFSVKSGDFWAVYDFDFAIINAAYPGAFDLNQPYVLTGSWTTNSDFYNKNGNGQDISHMSVWVRDPVSSDVPIPGTLLLTGLGLVTLGFFRAKQARV